MAFARVELCIPMRVLHFCIQLAEYLRATRRPLLPRAKFPLGSHRPPRFIIICHTSPPRRDAPLNHLHTHARIPRPTVRGTGTQPKNHPTATCNKKNKEEICSACDGLNKHTHKRTVHGIFIAPNKQNSVLRRCSRCRRLRRSEPGLCFFGSARPQHYEYDLSARCSDDRTTHTSDKLSAFKPVPINN